MLWAPWPGSCWGEFDCSSTSYSHFVPQYRAAVQQAAPAASCGSIVQLHAVQQQQHVIALMCHTLQQLAQHSWQLGCTAAAHVQHVPVGCWLLVVLSRCSVVAAPISNSRSSSSIVSSTPSRGCVRTHLPSTVYPTMGDSAAVPHNSALPPAATAHFSSIIC